jgi:C_GCAxxG_C_C family probable redox protein
MVSKKEKAAEFFSQGLNCAQSVIGAFSGDLRLDLETAEAVSSGFGAGMGRTQKTCGAVTGAVMTIGCKYFDKDNIPGSKDKARVKTREFLQLFEEKHGSSDCRALLDIDLGTEKGKAEYEEKNMAELKCQEYVKDACEMLEKIF